MASEAETAITDALTAPKKMKVDGREAEAHSLPDLIEADKYLRGQTAIKQSSRGILWQKIEPPGAN